MRPLFPTRTFDSFHCSPGSAAGMVMKDSSDSALLSDVIIVTICRFAWGGEVRASTSGQSEIGWNLLMAARLIARHEIAHGWEFRKCLQPSTVAGLLPKLTAICCR